MIKLMLQVVWKLKTIKNYFVREIEYHRLKTYKSVILNETLEEAISRLQVLRPNLPVKMADEAKNTRNIMLSIIIPVYNAEKYIKKCIDTILMQNIRYDYEILCINDGSTDKSILILQSYNIPNIKIFSQENSGCSAARNVGLSLANGKYIFFIDADDFLPDNSLNNLLDKAIETNSDILMGTVGKCVSEREIIFYPTFENDDIETVSLLKACNLVVGTAWGKLFKHEIWKSIQFFDNYAFEDNIIFICIFPQCKKFYRINKPVYCFRSNNSSLFKRQKKSIQVIDNLWGINEALKKFIDHNFIITDEHYQVFLWHLSVIIYSRLKSLRSSQVMRDAFLVASSFISDDNIAMHRTHKFKGKNKEIYDLLYKSFVNRDYGLWKQCCKVLKNSGEI